MSMRVRMSSTPCSHTKECRSCIQPYPDSDSPLQGSRICSSQMHPSAIMGSKAMDSMGSNLPERDFLSLQDAKKVSFKVNSGIRDSRVYAGISVSPATRVFQSDYCKEVVGACHSVIHEMQCSSIDSPVSIAIPKLEAEQNDVTSAKGVVASSNICCEGLNSDAIGCHLDTAEFIPVELIHVQDGNFDAKKLGAELLPGDRLCVTRQETQSDDNGQNEAHGECAMDPMVSGGECNPMVSHLEMTQQSPHRSVVDVPNSDARSGISTEHVDDHKGITWSSVVTKNTLGGHDTMEV